MGLHPHGRIGSAAAGLDTHHYSFADSYSHSDSDSDSHIKAKSKSFRALREFLLSWQKEPLRSEAERTAKPARRASAQRVVEPFEPDASRCEEAASVPCAPRGRRHGAQTRCAQTRAPLRPPPAAVLGSLYGSRGRRPERSESKDVSVRRLEKSMSLRLPLLEIACRRHRQNTISRWFTADCGKQDPLNPAIAS